MNKNTRNIGQLSSPLSIETLEEIVRNCQRNEQRLHELERHTRHERKKAERLLRETYQTKQERDKQMSISLNKISKPIEFFVSFDDNNYQDKPSTHRVRFNIPEKDHSIQIKQQKSTTIEDELNDLSRRCEDLLQRLQTQETIFKNSKSLDQSIPLRKSLELLRPEFISHSRQRVERINHLREEREQQQALLSIDSNPIIHRNVQIPSTYQEMKQISKKKYEQLPAVNERLQQELMNEIRRRNYLRAKIFRVRLRQHVLLHGRTNIDESLTMVDT